jgi:hypothetical protein
VGRYFCSTQKALNTVSTEPVAGAHSAPMVRRHGQTVFSQALRSADANDERRAMFSRPRRASAFR